MNVPLTPEQYESILDGMSHGIYIVDKDRKIVLWNHGAEQISGYVGRDVLGRFCYQNILDHCDVNFTPLCGSACPLKATMHDGHPREAVLYLRHKHGHRVPVKICAKPVRNSHGQIVGAVETFEECHEASELGRHAIAGVPLLHRDSDTGVCAQDSTNDYLHACVLDYRDDHIPFGIVMVSIDGRADFQRSHGAQSLSRATDTIGVTISKNIRHDDLVGNWKEGGFLVIVMNCQPASLMPIMTTLQRVIKITETSWWGDRFPVTVSMGATSMRADDTAETLLSRCEEALARCVARGGNCGDLV